MHIQHFKMGWGSSDNYSYLITDDNTKESWLIDPSIPKDIKLPNNSNLKAIVNTHHHYDHSDGNGHYLKLFPNAKIIAGKDSPLVSYVPKHNEILKLGDKIEIKAIHTPCHTQDSICYYFNDLNTGEKAVFTGDTLFIAGCGRFFEGDANEMNQALNIKLASLPKDTKIYPGHEYTKSNVKFAKSVLNNSALLKLEDFVNNNEVTTGIFTISEEIEYNPFMRLNDPIIKKKLNLSNELEIMQKLRDLKNSF